jgi:phage-related protein
MTTSGSNYDTKPIGWVRAARKAYEAFPKAVQDRVNTALTIAAEGGQAAFVKPLKGFERGLMEIALRYRTDAWRVIYVTEIAGGLWVIHAFGKKSKRGIKTPKAESDLVKARLARLKRELLQ